MDLVGAFIGRLRKRESGYAVLTLVGGTSLAQGIAVLSSPILTRLYSPEQFGQFTAVVALMVLLVSVSSLSYDLSIPLPASDTEAANALALSLVTILAVGIGTAVLMLLAGGVILGFFGAGPLASFGLLIVLGQIGAASVGALKQWAVRTKQFSQIATNSLIQTAALAAGQIIFGFAGLGSAGLLGGHVIGSLAGTTRLARSAWRTHAESFRAVTLTGIRAAATRYRRFAFLATPSSLLNTLGLRAPVLVLVAIYGAEVGGQYALAERIVALPATLVAGAVGQVFVSRAAPLARTDPIGLRALFVRTTQSLAAFAVIPMVLAAVLAPLLFGVIFGDAWAEAGLYVTLLSPWYFVYLIANPTGGSLDVLERQGLHLAREILRLGILGGAAVMMVTLKLTSLQAVALLGAGGALIYIIYWSISRAAIVEWERHPHGLPNATDGRKSDEVPPEEAGV